MNISQLLYQIIEWISIMFAQYRSKHSGEPEALYTLYVQRFQDFSKIYTQRDLLFYNYVNGQKSVPQNSHRKANA